MLGISVENLNVVYWEAGNVPATDAGRLRGCPLRKRRCILHCAGLGAECMTNFRPVSWAATSPQPPEYIVKSALQILERANSGHAPQKNQSKGLKMWCDRPGGIEAWRETSILRDFDFLPFPINVDLEDVYAQANTWNLQGAGRKPYVYLWND